MNDLQRLEFWADEDLAMSQFYGDDRAARIVSQIARELLASQARVTALEADPRMALTGSDLRRAAVLALANAPEWKRKNLILFTDDDRRVIEAVDLAARAALATVSAEKGDGHDAD